MEGTKKKYFVFSLKHYGGLYILAWNSARADSWRDDDPRGVVGSEDGTSGGRGVPPAFGEEFSGVDPADAEGGETDTLAGGGVALPKTAEEVVRVEAAAGAELGVETDAARPTARAYLFHLDDEAREVSLEEIPELVKSDDNFVWLDLSGFGEGEFRDLAEELELPGAFVRTTLSGWQRPRLDVFGERFFITATLPGTDPNAYRVYAGELDIFVDRNLLLSAHKLPLPLAGRVMARARQNPRLMQEDSSFLLYIIFDELLEHYEELVEGVEDQIERTEERALTDTSDDFLEEVLALKRYVFALSRLANHHRVVLNAFLWPDFPFLSPDAVNPYFRDLEGRFSRLMDSLDSSREAVKGAFDIFVSHVSHRTNGVMKVLTIVSSVLLPATFLLSVFGTSFEGVPLYRREFFEPVLLLIVLTMIATLLIFRRKRWI